MLNRMVKVLQKHTKILEDWSHKNKEQTDNLLEISKNSSQKVENNSEMPNKETWNDIKDLNNKTRMLLEACADTVDEYKSIGSYLKASERSRVWEICDNLDNCNFRDINLSYNQKALSMAQKTQENSELLGKNLQEALSQLDAFSLEAKSAQGLNSSIDTLSKVSSMTASSMVTLSSQLHSLLEFTALNSKKDSEEEILKALSDEQFLNTNDISSEHFSLNLKDHESY